MSDDPLRDDQTAAKDEQFQLPDGRILEFAPGTPPEVRRATFRKYLGLDKTDSGGVLDTAMDVGKGVAKGVGQTAADVGKAANAVGQKVFHRGMLPESAVSWADEALKPANTAQAVGKGAEQIAEYVVPGAAADAIAGKVAAKAGGGLAVRLGARAAANSAANAGLAALHGDNVPAAAIGGAVAPAIGEGVVKAGQAVGNRALPLVRSGLKPLVSQVGKVAGASEEGLNAKADKIAQFVIDNKLATREQARAFADRLKARAQQLLSNSNAQIDAPMQVMDALDRLEGASATTPGANAVANVRADITGGRGRLARELMDEVPVKPTPQSSAPATNTSVPIGAKFAAQHPDDAKAFNDLIARLEGETKGLSAAPTHEAEALANNASGESAASVEALNRQAGMKAKGQQFVVIDRAGRERPLIGLDAVDYQAKPGEIYGVREGDGSLRVLDNRGGRLPTGQSGTPVVRVAKPTITPREAMDLVTSPDLKVNVRNQFGQLQGPEQEAYKTVDTTLRNAAKKAVPGLADVQAQRSLAIQAGQALDREALREGNRGRFGLLPITLANGAATLGATGHPIAAVGSGLAAAAAHWLRNNPVKAGIYADTLRKAIENNNTQLIGRILNRVGVGSVAELTAPPATAQSPAVASAHP